MTLDVHKDLFKKFKEMKRKLLNATEVSNRDSRARMAVESERQAVEYIISTLKALKILQEKKMKLNLPRDLQ